MTQRLQEFVRWAVEKFDLTALSTFLDVIASAIAISGFAFGAILALWKAQSWLSRKLVYSIDVVGLSGQSKGWTLDPYKGECTLCIPGSYYSRAERTKSPLSLLYMAFMGSKAFVYRIASRGTPFLQKPDFYYSNYNYAGLDPAFDVLVVNTTNTDMIIVGLGIQICSVAHEMQGMGSPPARMIEILANYELVIPDVNGQLRQRGVWRDPRLLETQRVNTTVSVEPFSDRISLEAGGTLRYTLQLRGYVHNVPTQSVIRLFIKSSNHAFHWSRYVRLTHIGAEV
jgi:hypothetical protein